MATQTLDLICDLGNSNCKVALLNGSQLLALEVMPSLLRFTHDCNYVLGGGKFNGEEIGFILGYDNEDRTGVIKIGEESRGKLERLPYMLGGCVSALEGHIPVGTRLNVHIMMLQVGETEVFKNAVEKLASLSVDGKPMQLKPTLGTIAAEGLGCGVSAKQAHPEANEISVYDIGGGTANLTTYNTTTNVPKRKRFTYQPVGISVLEDLIVEQLKLGSSNGKVDRSRLKQALESNTYRLIESDFNGRDIRTQVDAAIEVWLNLPEMKQLLAKVLFLLQTGRFVSCCGGGFELTAVREAVETIVAVNCSSLERWMVPERTGVLGVLGVAALVKEENRQREELTNQRSATQKKAKAKTKTTEVEETSDAEN
jgi:hypothetical protein